jgi:hypothetical protein
VPAGSALAAGETLVSNVTTVTQQDYLGGVVEVTVNVVTTVSDALTAAATTANEVFTVII